MASARPPREIVAIAFDDFQILDVTGPLEMFSMATRMLEHAGRPPAYRVRLFSLEGGALRASSGLVLGSESLRQAPRDLDTLVVSGGSGSRAASRDAKLVERIATLSRRARRTTSVCTGAFLLARAGILDGRRATTHWDSCAALAEKFPKVTVEPDHIFVKDGSVYTSAGVTAGMDLALALIAEDLGKAHALEVARQAVVFLVRPGGQAQFSAQLAVQAGDPTPLTDLCAWIEEHLGDDLSVEVLARRARMSPRTFARRFVEEVRTTPAKYVLSARVSAARRRLEESSQGLERIASECGFGTTETLRRAFAETIGTTPSEYRERFSTS